MTIFPNVVFDGLRSKKMTISSTAGAQANPIQEFPAGLVLVQDHQIKDQGLELLKTMMLRFIVACPGLKRQEPPISFYVVDR